MGNELMTEFIRQIGQALHLAEDATELLLLKYESELEDSNIQGETLWHKEKQNSHSMQICIFQLLETIVYLWK